jgi:hypothetical protein
VAFDEGGEVNPISYMQKLVREALARGDTETAEEIQASLEDYTSLGRNLPRISLPERSNLVDLREARAREQYSGAAPAAAPTPSASAAPTGTRPRLGREATTSEVRFPDNTAPPAPERRPPVARRSAGIGAAAAPVEAAVAAKKMGFEDFLAPLREAGKPLREATDAYRQFLDKDEASAKEQSSRDRMLALAQAGFGMAEAASKPGATFLGSAAAAGGSYAKNMMQLNREADAAKRGIVKERLALAQAEAAGNKADYVAAYQNLNEYEKRLTQADQFKQEIDLKRAGLALERSLGFARVNAELVNSAMMAGLRKDEAAARAQNELRDLQAKIVTLADSRIGRLMMDETYRKATAEERAAMEQTEYETAARLLGGNLLSGGASSSAGQWGQVTVKP